MQFAIDSLPWNQKTPIGYVGQNGLSCIICGVYFFINGAVLMLFVSLTWILQSFTKMYRLTVKKYNNPSQNRNNEAILHGLIDFQNMARQWVLHHYVEPWFTFLLKMVLRGHRCIFYRLFMELMPVYNPLIMIQLICNMLLVATSVFRLYLVNALTSFFSHKYT